MSRTAAHAMVINTMQATTQPCGTTACVTADAVNLTMTPVYWPCAAPGGQLAAGRNPRRSSENRR